MVFHSCPRYGAWSDDGGGGGGGGGGSGGVHGVVKLALFLSLSVVVWCTGSVVIVVVDGGHDGADATQRVSESLRTAGVQARLQVATVVAPTG